MEKANAMKFPKVGDRLMRVMSGAHFSSKDSVPEPCVVTYVSKPKYYYQVKFVKSGVKECFKVPDVDELKQFQEDYRKFFNKKAKGVYVYESGALYPSITECAKALGVLPCVVSKHIHGGSTNVLGYHIYMLS